MLSFLAVTVPILNAGLVVHPAVLRHRSPQEQVSLLEEIWNAEPPFELQPCAHVLYSNPAGLADFQPYIRRLRAVSTEKG